VEQITVVLVEKGRGLGATAHKARLSNVADAPPAIGEGTVT
jgi:hypothetical protein